MVSTGSDSLLVPSVLDRLLDDEPDQVAEPALDRFTEVEDLERSVQRDLEDLLNTRREALQALPPEYEEANRALPTYGLPDLTAVVTDSPGDRARIRQAIEWTIVTHEPRLGRLKVALDGAALEAERGLRFRIDAVLRTEPTPVPVTFDAQVQLSTNECRVRRRS